MDQLILPSNEEIAAAHDDVEKEGAESETIMGLAQLALSDPHLAAFVQGVCGNEGKALGFTQPSSKEFIMFRSAIMGVLIGGLNLGIRIGEARAIVDVDDEDEDDENQNP